MFQYSFKEKSRMLSHFSRVRLYATPQTAAHQPPRPWGSPGKNTGVGCHFLLQCMKVKSESEVSQSCPTLSDPMDRSLPGSSVHGIFQARVLEWGAIAFSEKAGYKIVYDFIGIKILDIKSQKKNLELIMTTIYFTFNFTSKLSNILL